MTSCLDQSSTRHNTIEFGREFNYIPYQSLGLLDVWASFRRKEIGVFELLEKYKISSRFDNTIFENGKDDQIILCLNYDGIYGINNINHIMQNNNPNAAVVWGLATYKIGDPILFNDSRRYNPLLFNNQKGIIRNITKYQDKILFDIEINNVIDKDEARTRGLEVVYGDDKRTVVKIPVDKYKDSDDDSESNSTVVPFNIAYAISIHKSQGLEYNSVKIIISDNNDESITQNVFYTAITRAKNELKVYWSKNSAVKILKKTIKNIDYNKDVIFINQIYKLNGKYQKPI